MIVISGKSSRPCGTSASPRAKIACDDIRSMRSPFSSISPAVARSTPTIVFIVVDLPAPLPPSSATTLPLGTLTG